MGRYLQEQWNWADTDRSGIIESKELHKITQKMNLNTTKRSIKEQMRQHKFDQIKPSLNLEQFTTFFRELFSDRPELVDILRTIKSMLEASDIGGQTHADFVHTMQTMQTFQTLKDH